MRSLGVQLDWPRPAQGNGLWFVSALMASAVVLQVTVVPRLDIGALEATPNLVVVMVVAVAILRGVVVGAVVGFAGGLSVELMTPATRRAARTRGAGRSADPPDIPGRGHRRAAARPRPSRAERSPPRQRR